MTVERIQQRTAWDCGICALAMACDLKYEAVFEDLGKAGEASGGINDDLIDRWLREHDWAWQTISRNVWTGEKYEPVVRWPPKPFAPVHTCFVEATAGWHYCVMDFDGEVYDPFHAERHGLDHPDYKRVASVRGLYRIKRTMAIA